jgi:hypothetical protein
MDLPPKVVRKWQKLWHDLCEIAYHKGERVSSITTEFSEEEYAMFVNAHNTNPAELQRISLEIIWKRYGRTEPNVVNELESIYVPRILFECLGVYPWFEYSFPNCKIEFWETEM